MICACAFNRFLKPKPIRGRDGFLGRQALGTFLLSALVASGCALRAAPPRFRSFEADFAFVTEDGFVAVESGDRYQLAGIRMRAPLETGEPDLLKVINESVRRVSDSVQIVQDASSGTAVVLYRQPIYYMPHYLLPITMAMRILKPTTVGTVNELLVVMGAAKYDRNIGKIPVEYSSRLFLADEKAQDALWLARSDRPLHQGPLFTDEDGYKARIPKGDIQQRDQNIAECRERIRAVGWSGSSTELDSTSACDHDQVSALIRALNDDNRCVRRFAAHVLRKLSSPGRCTPILPAMIRALSDEDWRVRRTAAGALGEMGSCEVLSALQRTAVDPNPKVATEARDAIAKLAKPGEK